MEEKLKWSKYWDYETFCQKNNVDKYVSSNYVSFLEFEQKYIEDEDKR